MKKRVLLAMSGGVDSTAAAVLLRDQGYEVIGITMLLWRDQDGEEARRQLREKSSDLARRLSIEHHVIDLTDAFYERVVLPFIHAYQEGKTPNPCLLCNREFKFRLLPQLMREMLQKAGKEDFDYMATGHYARIIRDESGAFGLYRAKDLRKDQSYVLYHLKQEELSRLILPLGTLSKADARAIARDAGTPIPEEEESQDICFISTNYRDLLLEHGGFGKKGYFVDAEGQRFAKHKGIAAYTVGQRKKLGIALGKRVSILDIDPEKGDILLGPEENIRVQDLLLEKPSFNLPEDPALPLRLEAATRYQEKPEKALLEAFPDGAFPSSSGLCQLHFDEARRAPSPGQSAVFYQGEQVIGGAVIRRMENRIEKRSFS